MGPALRCRRLDPCQRAEGPEPALLPPTPRRVLKNESCGLRRLANHLVRELWTGERTPLYGLFRHPPRGMPKNA